MLAALQSVTPPSQHTQGTLLADILPWLVLLLGLVLAGAIVIYWVRRSLTAPDASSVGETGFTLHELRELHRTGEITKAEYERARAALIGGFQSSADADPHDHPGASDVPDASDNEPPP